MTTEQFEIELRAIHADFSIRVNPNMQEMSGIYWRNFYVCGCPSGHVFDEVRPDYQNSAGMKHAAKPSILAQARSYLFRIQNEPGFLEGELAFEADRKAGRIK